MKAAMLHGVKDLRIEDLEIPEVNAGEVLVQVKAATTCGTDLKIYQRGYVERVIKLPTVFGHEWAGEVCEVGEGLEWPEKGMRVRAGNSAPCLHCRMCQKGRYNLCEDMIWLWGAYAEFIKVPARTVKVNLQEIPSNVSFEEAAVTEPLACVLHGAEELDMKLGDTVVIVGAGPIGLLHLMTAKSRGARNVVSVDIAKERLSVAERLGADNTINAKEESVAERLAELTDNRGADVVIEAIGLPQTWEQAFKLVSKGGTILLFGGCPAGTQINVETEGMHYDELTVRGAFHATPLHFWKALNLIASRTIDVRSLVTKRTPLRSIQNTFETLITAKEEIKIAIIP